jgi:tetratricopeptide (TPR) repeat protein
MPGAVSSPRERDLLRSFVRRIDPSDSGAHNNLGVLYYQKGMIDESIESFIRALELDPKMLVAQRNLEIAYKQTGFYDRRMTELAERLRIDPADRDARWELGRAYAALGQHEQAVQEFQALLAANSSDLAVIIQLGLVEKQRGSLEAATEWFSRARDLDPESSVVQFYLGETLYNRGLNTEATAALERAIQLNPENADAHFLVGFVYGDLGRHQEAREAATRAVRLNPTFGRAQANLSLERYVGDRRSSGVRVPAGLMPEVAEGKALAHFNLGLAFRQKGYYNDALREYRMGMERGEDRLLTLQAMAEVHLLKRDHAAAHDLYAALTREQPDSPKLWNEFGVVLHQLGRAVDAVAAYHRALELAPDYTLARNNLGVALAQQGRYEEAIEALRDALRGEGGLVLPRLNLGLLLAQLRRHQLALQAYRQALDAEPGSAPAWNGIGLVLNELGRTADARNAFARAVESDPSSAEAHYNLSFALSALGDYDGALRAVTRAQQLDPYYVPQKFRLTMDLQYEDPTIAVTPEVSADVPVELAPQTLQFDPAVLDQIFKELNRPLARAPEPRTPEPLSLARDYLSKGLLELATAECNRAMTRGADEAEVMALAGEIFARRGLHGEALERFRAARAMAPEARAPRVGEVRALVALNRGAEALPEAERLATEPGDDPDTLVVLAEARRAAGDPAGALDAIRRARGDAPERADLVKLEGDIALGTGDLEAAREAYEAAIRMDARLVPAHVALGGVHERREAWSAAEAAYREALARLPTYGEAAVPLARVLRRTGRARDAVNLLADYLVNDPSDLDALFGLSQALVDDGRLEQALVALERLSAFDPDHAAGHFYAGVALARLRRYPDAVARWERVQQLDPDGPYAQKARRHARTALDLAHVFRPEAA